MTTGLGIPEAFGATPDTEFFLPLAIMGAMTWPHDRERQERAVDHFFYDAVAETWEDGTPMPKEVLHLARHTPHCLEIMKAYKDALKFDGPAAGQILWLTLCLSRHFPNRASVNSAVKILEARAGSQNKTGGGTTYRKAWSKFKSVAHFWGAFCPHGPDKFISIFKPDTLATFLATAELLRRDGEAWFARGQKKHGKPLLDPETTVHLPANINLPDIGPLVYDHLTAEDLAKL